MTTVRQRKKRKVSFVITSPIHYSRNLLILEALKENKNVDLSIIIGGTALVPKYFSKHGSIKELLMADGFNNIFEAPFAIEGDSHVTKTKSVGLGIIDFSLFFNNIKPDVVVLRGDRFEVLAAAIAASILHIPIAHIEGGDVSGTIDESIRHTITKLSQLHFVTNSEAYKRVLRMGEKKSHVFNFGSPDVEMAKIFSKKTLDIIDPEYTGSGAQIDLTKDYIVVLFHPVTTEQEQLEKYTETLLHAIYETQLPTFWFWPNDDAGAERISRQIRIFKDFNEEHNIRFMRFLPPKQFLTLLGNTKVLVGNSSSGIKECSYLGISFVNVGSRQKNRLSGENVINVPFNKTKIKKTIEEQIKIGRYPASQMYHAQNTSKKIAEKIANAKLYVQKEFQDNII